MSLVPANREKLLQLRDQVITRLLELHPHAPSAYREQLNRELRSIDDALMRVTVDLDPGEGDATEFIMFHQVRG